MQSFDPATLTPPTGYDEREPRVRHLVGALVAFLKTCPEFEPMVVATVRGRPIHGPRRTDSEIRVWVRQDVKAALRPAREGTGSGFVEVFRKLVAAEWSPLDDLQAERFYEVAESAIDPFLALGKPTVSGPEADAIVFGSVSRLDDDAPRHAPRNETERTFCRDVRAMVDDYKRRWPIESPGEPMPPRDDFRTTILNALLDAIESPGPATIEADETVPIGAAYDPTHPGYRIAPADAFRLALNLHWQPMDAPRMGRVVELAQSTLHDHLGCAGPWTGEWTG